ncbi:MAG TPA: copper chaperone [Betaproteobacteria bacterium]|nr:copper chaperone [Betaproteobacteria bacterium]
MIEFQVNDMTCGHCAGVITKAVASIDAAAKVEIDIPTHRVRISGTDKQQAIEAAISDAGYTPERIA